ncbi:hypothetical protein GGS24DRAFT_483336 [Hypoxylon argillaceum]|nr:hypothetical protein GGS24DRAFT_483336 [Hypoxylon argillaceum]
MTTSTTITFNSPDDFPMWEEDFMAIAYSRDLWTYIDPNERSPWPTRPSSPRIADFPIGPNEDPNTATISELTTAGRNLYLQAIQSHDRALRRYNEHLTKAAELSEWMRKSVKPDYRLTYMKASDTIDQWYLNLKELSATSRPALKFKYITEYKTFINATAESRSISDLAKWTEDWLHKLNRIIREEGTIESFELITDLDRALRRTPYSFWSAAFRSNNSEAIMSGSLTYQTIASSLRLEAVSIRSAQRKASSIGPIRGNDPGPLGGFHAQGTAQADEPPTSSEEASSEDEGVDHTNRSSKRPRANTASSGRRKKRS